MLAISDFIFFKNPTIYRNEAVDGPSADLLNSALTRFGKNAILADPPINVVNYARLDDFLAGRDVIIIGSPNSNNAALIFQNSFQPILDQIGLSQLNYSISTMQNPLDGTLTGPAAPQITIGNVSGTRTYFRQNSENNTITDYAAIVRMQSLNKNNLLYVSGIRDFSTASAVFMLYWSTRDSNLWPTNIYGDETILNGWKSLFSANDSLLVPFSITADQNTEPVSDYLNDLTQNGLILANTPQIKNFQSANPRLLNDIIYPLSDLNNNDIINVDVIIGSLSVIAIGPNTQIQLKATIINKSPQDIAITTKNIKFIFFNQGQVDISFLYNYIPYNSGKFKSLQPGEQTETDFNVFLVNNSFNSDTSSNYTNTENIITVKARVFLDYVYQTTVADVPASSINYLNNQSLISFTGPYGITGITSNKTSINPSEEFFLTVFLSTPNFGLADEIASATYFEIVFTDLNTGEDIGSNFSVTLGSFINNAVIITFQGKGDNSIIGANVGVGASIQGTSNLGLIFTTNTFTQIQISNGTISPKTVFSVVAPEITAFIVNPNFVTKNEQNIEIDVSISNNTQNDIKITNLNMNFSDAGGNLLNTSFPLSPIPQFPFILTAKNNLYVNLNVTGIDPNIDPQEINLVASILTETEEFQATNSWQVIDAGLGGSIEAGDFSVFAGQNFGSISVNLYSIGQQPINDIHITWDTDDPNDINIPTDGDSYAIAEGAGQNVEISNLFGVNPNLDPQNIDIFSISANLTGTIQLDSQTNIPTTLFLFQLFTTSDLNDLPSPIDAGSDPTCDNSDPSCTNSTDMSMNVFNSLSATGGTDSTNFIAKKAPNNFRKIKNRGLSFNGGTTSNLSYEWDLLDIDTKVSLGGPTAVTVTPINGTFPTELSFDQNKIFNGISVAINLTHPPKSGEAILQLTVTGMFKIDNSPLIPTTKISQRIIKIVR